MPVGSQPNSVLATLADQLVAQGSPGAVLGLRIGEGSHLVATGSAQVFTEAGPLAEPVPMTVSTSFDLGSVTKIVGTTLCLLALADTGRLRTSDRLGTLLPQFAGTAVSSATVGELLSHRAGLWEWWPTYTVADDPLHLASSLPLRYPPRSARHYSDLGFMLLGAIVETVAGKPLPIAVQELVIEPLGLTHTRFGEPATGTQVAATSRGDEIEFRMVATGVPYPVTASTADFPGWRTQVLAGEVNDGNAFHSFGGAAGHAGLFSTVPDLLTVGHRLLTSLRGDGPFGTGNLAEFLTVGPDPAQALGFRRWQVAGPDARGIDVFGHTGFPGTAIGIVPELDCALALATNRLHVTGEPVQTEQMWTAMLTAVVNSVQ